jgi:hypothetical protein
MRSYVREKNIFNTSIKERHEPKSTVKNKSCDHMALLTGAYGCTVVFGFVPTYMYKYVLFTVLVIKNLTTSLRIKYCIYLRI